MKKTLLLLALTAAVQGCALLKPQSESGAPIETDAALAQLSTSHAPYTVTGDADFPYQLHLSSADADARLDRFYLSVEQSDESVPGDIWQRIRDGFSMPDMEHPRIDQQLKWYAAHQQYLDRIAERAGPYMHFIVEELEKHQVPLEMALLPIVESAFQPFAYSHGRASGIWQFIPSTGKLYGLKQDWWYDGRRDVYASTLAAIRLLKALHREFDGDWMLALAAYNSGSGNVRRAIRNNKRKNKPTDFFSLDLPLETRHYVPKLLAIKKLVADPAGHGLQLQAIVDEPYFEKIDLDSQIDLALAAELADLDIESIYRMNPGFNRWSTSPDGPHHLLVPLENAEVFKENLAAFPAEKRLSWVRHKIKPGETISTIATKYHVSTDVIKRVNNMRGNLLRAGHSLTIPVASKQLSSYVLSESQRLRATQNTPRGGTRITHIVQSGDTLWDLSRKHNVGVRQLAKWNGMAPRDPLVPGTSLVIWTRKPAARAGIDPGIIYTPPRRNVTQRIGYRVRPGDSLALISRKFNVSVAQLVKWNKLDKSRYLQPGQHLTLYIDVTGTSTGNT